MFARWRSWPRAGYALCLVLLATLAGLTWRQSQMYGDVAELYGQTIAENPDCWLAHANLGVVLARRGRVDEAVACFQQALKIKPDYAEAHNNLGVALADQGRLDEAIQHYRKALEIEPDYAEAHTSLGIALAGRGQSDEAMAHYRKALAINSGDTKAHANLGAILADKGRFDEALVHYQKAIEINPDGAGTHNNLAWLLATCPAAALRYGAAAVEHSQRAIQFFGGRRPDVLDTLAAAYAEAGRFPEALATARKALKLATQQHNPVLTNAVQARIALYERGKPYRQPLPASAPPPKP